MYGRDNISANLRILTTTITIYNVLEPGTLQPWRIEMTLLNLFPHLQIKFRYASYHEPHAAHRNSDLSASHTRPTPSPVRSDVSNVFNPRKENVLPNHCLRDSFPSSAYLANSESGHIDMMEWTIERYEILTSALQKFLDIDLRDLSKEGAVSEDILERVKETVDVVIERRVKRKVAEEVRAKVASNEELDCDNTEDGDEESANKENEKDDDWLY
ncbi:hypothetical protein V1515DRAFT_609534, partial [Lipomyces mesembrius]